MLFSFALFYYQSLKIQISPSIYECEVIPKEQKSFTITLKNNSSRQFALKGYILSLNLDTKGSFSFVDDPYQLFSCQSWLDINPKRILITPGEERKVLVSIKVPPEIEGGNYAAVMFDLEKSKLPEAVAKVDLTIRTGTMVLLTTKKKIRIDAEIHFFKISQHADKSIFEVMLKNNSTVHIKP